MAIFHFSAATGTLSGGQSARAKFDYLSRGGKYADREDRRLHLESGNMPAWAAEDASKYWSAADDHERANGRLFKHLEIALPVELSFDENLALARAFVTNIASSVPGGTLPYTFTMHEGAGRNPHFDVMFSERLNDSIERGPELWFSRAATGKTKTAADGGAKKTDALKPAEWLTATRKLWADMANEALAKAGHSARIDHRSLKAQREEALAGGDHERAKQLDRPAQEHIGPQALAYENRTGKKSERRKHIERRQRERVIDTRQLENTDRALREARAELSRLSTEREAGLRQKDAITRRIAAERAAGKVPAPALSAPKVATRAAPARIKKIGRMPPRMLATLPPDLAKWARESIKQIEDLAKLLERWKDQLAASFAMHQRMQRAERARLAAQARAQSARPVAPMPAAAPAAAPAASQPQGAKPPSPPPGGATASQVDEREKLRQLVERALAGKGIKKSDALIRAAEGADAASVDRLIEAGAVASEKTVDAAIKGGSDAILKKTLSELRVVDYNDLSELARKVSTPEARRKLRELAAQAKASGSISGIVGERQTSAGTSATTGRSGPKGP